MARRLSARCKFGALPGAIIVTVFTVDPWRLAHAASDEASTDLPSAAVTSEPSVAPVAPPVILPQLLEPLVPKYPANATGDARVILHVTLDAAGRVGRVDVKEGVEPFASEARRVAAAGRFSPAQRGGVPIPARITVAVDFTYTQVTTSELPPDAAPASVTAAAAQGGAGVTPDEQEVIDIVITAPRVDSTERVISKAEARLMAGTFGDPLRAVELLPGVTPLISGVPYLYVRGAPAGSVNFYLNDARVPQLYHVGPGSSILHPQLAEGVALRSGPYRARYGDATSGVITARVEPKVTAPSAELETKAFESGGFVAAPFAEGDGAVAVAAKRSHLQYILDRLNPELALSYWDYQAAAVYDASARDHLTLLVLGAKDFVGEKQNVDAPVQTQLQTEFHRLKVGYNRNLAPNVDLSNYVIFGVEGTKFADVGQEMNARSLGGGTTLSCVVSDGLSWAVGATAEAMDYDGSKATAWVGAAHNGGVSRVDTQAALWAESRVSPRRGVYLDAGLRAVGYTSADKRAFSVEPRLTSTLELSEHVETVLATGYTTQTPSASVPAPAVRPAELRGGIQRALQRAATVRYRSPFELTVEATAFFNTYLNLSDPLSLGTVPDPLGVGSSTSGAPLQQEELNFTDRPNGRAYGVELLLRRPFTHDLSGMLAYTLSRSTRRLGSQDALSSFDRTHTLNLTLGYKLGAGYDLGTRVLLYSGLPVREVGVLGGHTDDRSAPFLRVDFRASKEWHLSWTDLMLIVEVLNATFAKETLGVACSPQGCVTAEFGPVSVPSVGLRGTFGGARASAE